MSLYGVMRTGGSGMNAQSNKLSTVADNIANVNTTGYKRASTEFSSLVLQSGTGNYNSGSVETHVRYAISDPGNLNFTTSATDLAIQGNGFFVVNDAGGTPFLTRAGSFVPDGQGNLVNAGGFYLMGYDLKNGPPTVVSNGLSGLSVVNIAQTALQGNPSTKATVSANLDANAAISAGPPAFTSKTSIVTYDNIGNKVTLDVYAYKTAANTWDMEVYNNAKSTRRRLSVFERAAWPREVSSSTSARPERASWPRRVPTLSLVHHPGRFPVHHGFFGHDAGCLRFRVQADGRRQCAEHDRQGGSRDRRHAVCALQ